MVYNYVILGAGLAGLSLADALLEHTSRTLILDTRGIAAGASGTPVGMINPATGRRGKKVWHVEEALPAIHTSLQAASEYGDTPFFVRCGILRPALDRDMAGEMHKRFQKSRWPPGWCYWMTEKEIKAFHPGIQCVDGGLWLPPGMAVRVPAYLSALAHKVKAQGATIAVRPSYTYHRYRSAYWKIKTDRGETIKARKLVFASGAGILNEPIWSFLPLNSVKGQIAQFKVDPHLDFKYSISAKGYLAHVDQHRLTVGSTYEHDFKDGKPDREGLDRLTEKAVTILPELSGKISLHKQWAGFRVSAEDHKPVLGEHPTLPNTYLFTGLGSKGLLHGRYLGEKFARYLNKGISLPQEIAISRFTNTN